MRDLRRVRRLRLPDPRREPFGFAPLEAAARGCVPIMSQACGIAEWFVHGVHFLKAPRTAEAFAEAVRGDPRRRDRPRADRARRVGGRSAANSTSTRSLPGSSVRCRPRRGQSRDGRGIGRGGLSAGGAGREAVEGLDPGIALCVIDPLRADQGGPVVTDFAFYNAGADEPRGRPTAARPGPSRASGGSCGRSSSVRRN